MSRSPWTVLGIRRTQDRNAIRRAYAARLKLTNPEDDPEGFMALREAYETALARAAQPEPVFETSFAAEPEEEEDAEAGDYEDLDDAPVPAAEWEDHDTPAPQPQASDAVPGLAEEVEEFNALRRELIKLLDAPWGATRVQQQALAGRIFTHPATESIAVRSEAEAWFAHVIAQNLPQSDPLIEPAIQAFGWRPAPGRSQHWTLDAIFGRLEEWKFANRANAPYQEDHVAWRLLTEPLRPGWRMRWEALNPAVVRGTRKILALADGPMPGLRHWFDRESAAWWLAHFERPHVTLASLLTIPVVFAFLAGLGFALGLEDTPIAWAAAALLSLGAPWALAHGLGPVRQRIADAADEWRRLDPSRDGWVLALPLALLAAGPLAGLSVGWAVMTALGLLIAAWIWLSTKPGEERGIGSVLLGTAWFVLVGGIGIVRQQTPELALGWFTLAFALWLAWWVGVERTDRLLLPLAPLLRLAVTLAPAAALIVYAIALRDEESTPQAVQAGTLAALLAAWCIGLGSRTRGVGRWALFLTVPLWFLTIIAFTGALPRNTLPPVASEPGAVQSCAPEAPRTGSAAPQLCGDPSRLITSGDYPERSRAEGLTGRSVLRLALTPEGVPFDCEVTGQSGSGLLDDTACTLAKARARFQPAQDINGNRIASYAGLEVFWGLAGGSPRVTVRQVPAAQERSEPQVRAAPPPTNQAKPAPLSRIQPYLTRMSCPPEPENPDLPRPAQPCGLIDKLFGPKGYSPAAMAEHQAQDGRFRLTVSEYGLPTGCTVEQSTGSKLLDKETCAILSRSLRFMPARSSVGEFREGGFGFTLNRPS